MELVPIVFGTTSTTLTYVCVVRVRVCCEDQGKFSRKTYGERDFTQDMVMNVLVREQLLVHTSPPRQLLCSPLFLQSQFLPSDGLGLVVEGHAACIGVGLRKCGGVSADQRSKSRAFVLVHRCRPRIHCKKRWWAVGAKQREGEGRGGDVRGRVYTSSLVYPPPNPNAAVPQTRSICSPFCLHEKRARVRPAQAGGGSSSVWPGRARCVGVKAGHQSAMWSLTPSSLL